MAAYRDFCFHSCAGLFRHRGHLVAEGEELPGGTAGYRVMGFHSDCPTAASDSRSSLHVRHIVRVDGCCALVVATRSDMDSHCHIDAEVASIGVDDGRPFLELVSMDLIQGREDS